MTEPARERSALDSVVNLRELQDLARPRMEPPAYDYVVGGSWDEITLHENEAAFARRRLLPRVLVDVSRIELSTTMLGRSVSMPLGLAPTAYGRYAHPEGELASARAASAAGVIMCLSTLSSYSLEQVAEASGAGPRWFQLYAHRDRERNRALLDRAREAGYSAIVLTVDLPMAGYRERDLRNRLPPPDALGNLEVQPTEAEFSDFLRGYNDAGLTWDGLAWLRETARLPLVVKGIMTVADARLAVEHGVDGIVVSNHGGRQLDRAPATLDVLESITEAVAGRLEVYLDGGVRRGTDILMALALGARAVFFGRPYLYGLAVGGEAGVARALSLIRAELETAMVLLGVRSPAEVRRAHLLEV